MTARVAAFRESFYRCLTTDWARIQMLRSRRSGFVALYLNGDPVTYDTSDPVSLRRYVEALEMADRDHQVEYLGLNLWDRTDG